MRKIYILLIFLIVGIIGMAYLYFSNLNTETSANELSLKVAASNSAIIFTFDNDKGFYEILSGQNLLQQVIGEQNSKLLYSIKETLVNEKTLTKFIDGQKIYVGISSGKNNEIDFLITTQSQTDVENIFSKLNINKTKLKSIENAYQLTFPDSSICFLAIKNKLIVVSNSLNEIENSITNNVDEHNFSNFIKSNSRFNKNTLANLYIDYNKIPAILKGILNSNLVGELNVFSKQNAYAALSYNFSTERLLFNGTTTFNNANSYYNLFNKAADQKITITSILPDKTANYTAYTFSDYGIWYRDLTKLLEIRKEDKALNKSLKKINDIYRIDLYSQFQTYFNNELITFQLNTGEKLGAIALKNGDKVNQILLDLSTEYAPNIRILKEANIPYTFFGDPFKKFERPFYTIINSNLIMANYASTIQSFLNSYNENKLLINEVDYKNLSNQLLSSATITYYINNKNSTAIFGRNLKMAYYKKVISKNEIGGFSAFSYQLSGDNGKFLSNVLLFKIPEKSIQIDTTNIN